MFADDAARPALSEALEALKIGNCWCDTDDELPHSPACLRVQQILADAEPSSAPKDYAGLIQELREDVAHQQHETETVADLAKAMVAYLRRDRDRWRSAVEALTASSPKG